MNRQITVCLLTYNRSKLLPKTLNSLLVQTYKNFELIINDNNSTDKTEIICREYAKKDARIKYFKNIKNFGYAENQNLAIKRAKNNFIALVHDGDWYHPQLLAKWVKALEKHPDCALVFNGYYYQTTKNDLILPLSEKCRGTHIWNLFYAMGTSPIWGIVMLRRSMLNRLGSFDLQIPTLADVDMWLRVSLRYNIAYIPEALVSLSGREPNHPARVWNWNVAEEEDKIWWYNLARKFKPGSQKRKSYERHIAVKIWRRNILNILWCLRKIKLLGVIAGIGHFLTYQKRKSSALATIDNQKVQNKALKKIRF